MRQESIQSAVSGASAAATTPSNISSSCARNKCGTQKRHIVLTVARVVRVQTAMKSAVSVLLSIRGDRHYVRVSPIPRSSASSRPDPTTRPPIVPTSPSPLRRRTVISLHARHHGTTHKLRYASHPKSPARKNTTINTTVTQREHNGTPTSTSHIFVKCKRARELVIEYPPPPPIRPGNVLTV